MRSLSNPLAGPPPSRPLFWAVFVLAPLVTACEPTPDTCTTSDDTSLSLGSGVGGAFMSYTDGQSVGLDVAPQGGFGVSTLLLTTGLAAGDEVFVQAQLDTRIDGALTGSFLLEEAPLLCRSDGQGGMISGVVVGFDPDVYSSDDDLLALNGEDVILDVTVSDSEGNQASAQQAVVVVVGTR